jgi:serine/threonine-protein kinase
MTTLPIGASVDHYTIESFIGAGSMGDVYRGVDATLGRKVAIKILSERHRENQELRQRFEREARAVAATTHPNVVQVFTTGSHDDRPYLAMEFLDGVDLGSSVDRGGPWPSLATAQAILDAARGLEAAANAGLIHRDVKPSNLVRLGDGSVKITDFGLAKPLEPGDEPALTAMGVVVGTPDYIAPEQARGDPIDARVDIYALGGTTYYMLTGTPPFRTGIASEDKYLKVVARHLRNPAPDARKANPQVDPELAQLARDMMAKKADERPSYARVIEKLQRIVARLQASGSPAAVPNVVASPESSGRVAPTPFLGHEPVQGVSPPSRTSSDSDSALTMIRRPSQPPTAADVSAGMSGTSDSLDFGKPRRSRGLIAATIVAVAIFLAGLGMLLFGPMPKPTLASTEPGLDAGIAPAADAAPTRPEPPPYMLLIDKPDGTPWFFVDKRPVTADELNEALTPNKKIAKRDADKPAVNVSYDDALAYAEKKGGRLLTADEWNIAARAEGFEFSGRKMYEWIAAEPDDSGSKAPVRSGPSKAAKRSKKGHKDVTFRLARDLPR